MVLSTPTSLDESEEKAHRSPPELHPVGKPTDDLSRDVYGLLGMPIDALSREAVCSRIIAAAVEGKPFLLSTPNVNFMVESKRDPAFRESLLSSDLCCVDGMPIVWIARLFGIPIPERVSGSDLFETIRSHRLQSRPVRVFLFGGGEGVAETVCRMINDGPGGMRCVGWLNPGFGAISEMSSPEIMQTINGSNADLLALFLTAKKAQSWLVLNHRALRTPVRGQFGATINYQAGVLRRAPKIAQRLGLEWLWRIKEEPYLWRRYWLDGLLLARLLITRAIPVAIGLGWHRYMHRNIHEELLFERGLDDDLITIRLSGYATQRNVAKCIPVLRSLLSHHRDVAVDLAQGQSIDPRFFGLLLTFRKELGKNGKSLKFIGVSKKCMRMFRLNGFEFLLDANSNMAISARQNPS